VGWELVLHSPLHSQGVQDLLIDSYLALLEATIAHLFPSSDGPVLAGGESTTSGSDPSLIVADNYIDVKFITLHTCMCSNIIRFVPLPFKCCPPPVPVPFFVLR